MKKFPNDLFLAKKLDDRQKIEKDILETIAKSYYHCLSDLNEEELNTLNNLVKKTYPKECQEW